MLSQRSTPRAHKPENLFRPGGLFGLGFVIQNWICCYTIGLNGGVHLPDMPSDAIDTIESGRIKPETQFFCRTDQPETDGQEPR